MNAGEITSVRDLNNHDGSICLLICTHTGHIFVTISKAEFISAGKCNGLNANKQLAIEFFNKYGVGRP